MSERLWRLLLNGLGAVLLFLAAAYGLQAAYSWKQEPERLGRNLSVLLVLGLLILFLAFLARSHRA